MSNETILSTCSDAFARQGSVPGVDVRSYDTNDRLGWRSIEMKDESSFALDCFGLATLLAFPAMAQQSSTPHRYLGLFNTQIKR
jgi:hypothetical protein